MAVDIIDAISSITVILVLATINYLLIQRRRRLGIKSLDNLILVFSTMLIMAIFQLLHVFVPGASPLFDVNSEISPVMVDPIRIFNYLFIIALFFFIEYTINESANKIRLLIISIATTLILTIGIIDLNQNILLRTNDLFPFSTDSRLDEMIFDFVQLFVISFATIVFYFQQATIKSKQLKKYARLLLIAATLYSIAMIIEVMEHFVEGLSIDAFFSSIPTVLILGYVYISNPRFVYVIPTDVKFLQIVNQYGTTIYAADFIEDANNIEFLVGPGLFSMSQMLGELVQSRSTFNINTIDHSSGSLIFEHHEGLIGVLQTSRDSRFLRGSLKYFLSEFANVFAKELANFKGTLGDDVSPDSILTKCVPIVESRAFVSQVSRT